MPISNGVTQNVVSQKYRIMPLSSSASRGVSLYVPPKPQENGIMTVTFVDGNSEMKLSSFKKRTLLKNIIFSGYIGENGSTFSIVVRINGTNNILIPETPISSMKGTYEINKYINDHTQNDVQLVLCFSNVKDPFLFNQTIKFNYMS